eukprot:6194522-Pleurochrysis_carterae.AAC.1
MGTSCSRDQSIDTAKVSGHGKDKAVSPSHTDVNDTYGSMTDNGLSVLYDNSVKFGSKSVFANEYQSENFNSEHFSGRYLHARRYIRRSKRSARSQRVSGGENIDSETSHGGFIFEGVDSSGLPGPSNGEARKETEPQTEIVAPVKLWRAVATGAAAPLHRTQDAEPLVALSSNTEANSSAHAVLDQASEPISAHRIGPAQNDSMKKVHQDDAAEEDVRASTRFIVAVALTLFMQKSEEDVTPRLSQRLLASEPFAAADLKLGATLGSQLFGRSSDTRPEDTRQAAVMDAVAILHVACDAFKLRQSCLFNVLYIIRRAAHSGICFDSSTYRTLLLTAILISIKEYKECAVWADDLRVVFPSLQLGCLSYLEPLLLSAVDYQVSLLSGNAERERVVSRVEKVRETEEVRVFYCTPVSMPSAQDLWCMLSKMRAGLEAWPQRTALTESA